MSTPATAPAPAQQIPANVLLAGGESTKAYKNDGTTEEVFVRLVPLSEAAKYFQTIGDLTDFLAFITGKPKAFIDGLTDDCQFDLDKRAKDLNSFRMGRYLDRQKATQQMLKEQTKGSTGSPTSAPTE